jgi:hypothetical protein
MGPRKGFEGEVVPRSSVCISATLDNESVHCLNVTAQPGRKRRRQSEATRQPCSEKAKDPTEKHELEDVLSEAS